MIALHQAGLLPRGDSLAGAPSDSVTVEGTRIEETLGDQARTYVNHYDGLVTERGIDFVLYDTNGRGPIEFTMRRE